MKALGNYRIRSQIERRLGTVVSYDGPKAVVRFQDGIYSLPAEKLREVGVAEGGRFVLLIERRGGEVVSVRVDRAPEARPPMVRRRTAVVVVSRPRPRAPLKK